MEAGPAIATYIRTADKSAWDVSSSTFDKALKQEQAKYDAILATTGKENAHVLHEELSLVMLRDVTIERHNPVLDKALEKISEIEERMQNVGVTDTGSRSNMSAQFIRHFQNMLLLSRAIAQGARNRDESRGAHYKPEFDKRDDENWSRSTLAFHKDVGGGHNDINFVRGFDHTIAGKPHHATDAVDLSLVKPRTRKYETAGAANSVVDDKKPALAATV